MEGDDIDNIDSRSACKASSSSRRIAVILAASLLCLAQRLGAHFFRVPLCELQSARIYFCALARVAAVGTIFCFEP